MKTFEPMMSIKNKKAFVVGVILALSIWVWSYNKDQSEKTCLQHVEYRGSSPGYYRINNNGEYDNRKFKTQNEAMEYCIKVLGADF